VQLEVDGQPFYIDLLFSSMPSSEGWGARVIDRLSPRPAGRISRGGGFSPRSLKYMRPSAKPWPEEAIVQPVAALLPWDHHMVLLDRLKDAFLREWYLRAALEYRWSRNVMVLQIQSGLLERVNLARQNPGTSEMCRARTSYLGIERVSSVCSFSRA
jgi:hypothetical protein